MKPLKFILVSLGLGLLVFGTNRFRSKAQARSDSPDFSAIDQYVKGRMRSARIPGIALAIVKGDQIIYSKGYGRADPSGRAVTPQMPFMIGSVTKPITALAVMQLVEAGKIELDMPVQRYIPWFRVSDPEASAQITVRQLLYQTSGMPQPPSTQQITENDDQVLERSVRLLANLELIGRLGSPLHTRMATTTPWG